MHKDVINTVVHYSLIMLLLLTCCITVSLTFDLLTLSCHVLCSMQSTHGAVLSNLLLLI